MSTDAYFDDIQLEFTGLVSSVPINGSSAGIIMTSYPNPFNPSTNIVLSQKEAGDVNLAIHDVAGRMIRTLHQGHLALGQHTFTWHGVDSQGKHVAAGIYLCTADRGGKVDASIKVLLVP